MKNNVYLMGLAFLFVFWGMLPSTEAQTLLKVLSKPDSTTKASVKVFQDQRIDELVFARRRVVAEAKQSADKENVTDAVKPEEGSRKASGFRVQIYSGNTQKIAKNEAFSMEDTFQNTLPDIPVYVTYRSPFWKVRAGNCRTREEASELKAKIAEAMPQIRQDLYIVADVILVK
jgi:hypothetical protein